MVSQLFLGAQEESHVVLLTVLDWLVTLNMFISNPITRAINFTLCDQHGFGQLAVQHQSTVGAFHVVIVVCCWYAVGHIWPS